MQQAMKTRLNRSSTGEGVPRRKRRVMRGTTRKASVRPPATAIGTQG
jgi:hypothetical protein